jgi:hypothetical protein
MGSAPCCGTNRHVDPEVLWSIVTGQLDALDHAAAALLDHLDEAENKEA